MLIDVHTHLNNVRFSRDLSAVAERLKESEVFAVVDSSTNLEESKISLELSHRYPFIFSSLGFHPFYAADFDFSLIETYRGFIKSSPKVIAIGEIGLDVKAAVPLARQMDVFKSFLQLAKEFNLTAVIHNRGFKDTILDVISEIGPQRVVFHCFSQDKEFLEKVTAKGYFVSFAGNITFKNAILIKEAAMAAPLDKLLVETDAPFLAPQIIRGKRNEPVYVKEVIKEIASLKKTERDYLEKVLEDNFRKAFAYEG
ncbi:MAG: TatD family hydrolase [Candidatus Omnitrophica bacterium]|nr:TatD family hydrolase [Candidatus Omnitrophota bacterium]